MSDNVTWQDGAIGKEAREENEELRRLQLMKEIYTPTVPVPNIQPNNKGELQC